jgi:hypothetical protein
MDFLAADDGDEGGGAPGGVQGFGCMHDSDGRSHGEGARKPQVRMQQFEAGNADNGRKDMPPD